MTGEVKAGLYRLFTKRGKKIRFFKIYVTSGGETVVKEFKDGDLHQLLKETKSLPYAKRLWPKLVPWQ